MDIKFREYNQTINVIDSLYHEAAVTLGLSDCELEILYLLCEEGSGCNQSVFYKQTGLSRSTVNSAIRKMEQKGLLYLEAGTGRNTRVVLTEQGETYLSETAGKIVEIENRIYDTWTQEELDLYLALNERFAEQLAEGVAQLKQEG